MDRLFDAFRARFRRAPAVDRDLPRETPTLGRPCVDEGTVQVLDAPPPVAAAVAPPAPEPEPARPAVRLLPDESFTYGEILDEIGRVCRAAKAGQVFGIGKLHRMATWLASDLAAKDTLLLAALDVPAAGFSLPRHLLNTGILAVKIAMGARWRPAEFPQVALAGCLHDLGMVTVPDRLLGNTAALAGPERALITRQADQGPKLLRGLGIEYEWLAKAAGQCHEREDGSGYPQGLAGDTTAVAQVVGLACWYEQTVHGSMTAPPTTPYAATKTLMTTDKARFPEPLLRGLILGLTNFPVGSYVRLSSGELGRILQTTSRAPLRPVVEVLASRAGGPLVSSRIEDLAKGSLLKITEACLPSVHPALRGIETAPTAPLADPEPPATPPAADAAPVAAAAPAPPRTPDPASPPAAETRPVPELSIADLMACTPVPARPMTRPAPASDAPETPAPAAALIPPPASPSAAPVPTPVAGPDPQGATDAPAAPVATPVPALRHAPGNGHNGTAGAHKKAPADPGRPVLEPLASNGIDLDVIYQHGPRVRAQALCGEHLLVPRNKLEMVYRLNGVGSFIWAQIDGRTPGWQIVEAVAARAGIDALAALQEFRVCVEELVSLQAITPVTGAALEAF